MKKILTITFLLLSPFYSHANTILSEDEALLLKFAYESNYNALALLLKYSSVDTEVCDSSGHPPLEIVASNGCKKCVKRLLDASANVNCLNLEHYTPLYQAAEEGHSEIVDLLLTAPEIDVDIPNRGEITPLGIASIRGHSTIVKALLDTNANPDTSENPLILATLGGHTRVVEVFLSHPNIDPSYLEKYGNKALSIALEHGHHEIAQLLQDTLDPQN